MVDEFRPVVPVIPTVEEWRKPVVVEQPPVIVHEDPLSIRLNALEGAVNRILMHIDPAGTSLTLRENSEGK
jgi:hypothetical protein